MKTETRSFYQAAVERTVLRITETLDEALDLALLPREEALSPPRPSATPGSASWGSRSPAAESA